MESTLDLGILNAGNLLDALPDGAYITDLERKIVFWNRAAERITGWSRTDVVGKHCSDNILVHIDKDGHPLCGREFCPLHRSIVTGEGSTCPLMVFAQAKNGERIPVEVSVAPIRDAEGTVVGGVEVFRGLADLMDDLNRAQLIQEQALACDPVDDTRVRIAAHYIPQELVGGDFYRVERLDEDRIALFVADVTGHGISAALYSMQLRSLWEDLRGRLATPQAFLAEMNEGLHRLAMRDDYFATGVHVVLDVANGTIHYMNAGHPAPLVIGRTGQVAELPAHGPALGLLPEPSYSVATAKLEPGDTLLLYTDGAVEVFDEDREELGTEAFVDMATKIDLSRGELALEELEVALLKYSNQIRLPDDLTLLSAHRVQ